jgi:hypothetical protein
MADFFVRLEEYLKHQVDSLQRSELLKELKQHAPRGVRVVHPYDLRANQQVKYEDTIKNTRDWTAFVNKTGRLVHVMRDGVPYILIRLPHLRLHGSSVNWMADTIGKALYEGLS